MKHINYLKKTVFIVALSAGLFISCKEKAASGEEEMTVSESATISEAPQVVEEQVTLNNGATWEVDDKVTAGIMEMKKTIQELPAEESRHYGLIKEELEREFNTIFDGTTLDDDARAQFDIYMKPIKIHLSDLGSPDAATRQQAIQKISAQLDLFSNYFS